LENTQKNEFWSLFTKFRLWAQFFQIFSKLGLRVQGSALRAQGSGLRDQGSELRAHGSGLRAQESGLAHIIVTH